MLYFLVGRFRLWSNIIDVDNRVFVFSIQQYRHARLTIQQAAYSFTHLFFLLLLPPGNLVLLNRRPSCNQCTIHRRRNDNLRYRYPSSRRILRSDFMFFAAASHISGSSFFLKDVDTSVSLWRYLRHFKESKYEHFGEVIEKSSIKTLGIIFWLPKVQWMFLKNLHFSSTVYRMFCNYHSLWSWYWYTLI